MAPFIKEFLLSFFVSRKRYNDYYIYKDFVSLPSWRALCEPCSPQPERSKISPDYLIQKKLSANSTVIPMTMAKM